MMMNLRPSAPMLNAGAAGFALLAACLACTPALTAQTCQPPEGKDLEVVYCDLSPLRGWPEFEFKKELQERLLREHKCPPDVLGIDFNLYLSVPKLTEGEPARSFEDVQFQFHWREKIRTISRGLDNVSTDTQAFAIPPDRTTSLEGLTEVADENLDLSAPSSLIEFVFVPRIRQRAAEEGLPEEFAIQIAPISAVPSRVLDQPAEGFDARIPVDLRSLRKELEVVGVEFIDIMRQHLVSLGYSPRLEARDTYTWEQLRYFELVLRQRLASQFYQNREERTDEKMKEFEYIQRFRQFWGMVEERSAALKKEEEKKLQDIFAGERPPSR